MTGVLKQRWYLLGQPWCHSDDAGTAILAGNMDPHVATHIADLDDLSYLWEESDELGEEEAKAQARALAEHIVDVHNGFLNPWTDAHNAPSRRGTHFVLVRREGEQKLRRDVAFYDDEKCRWTARSKQKVVYYADPLLPGELDQEVCRLKALLEREQRTVAYLEGVLDTQAKTIEKLSRMTAKYRRWIAYLIAVLRRSQ